MGEEEQERAEIFMMPQGYHVGKSDLNDIKTLRDRIAFEICATMNTGCGSKDALLRLVYHTADLIIEQTNRAGAVWTPIETEKPDPLKAGVLYRFKAKDDQGYIAGLAVPILPADDIDNVPWRSITSNEPLWPDGAEWMAIPI